MIEEHPELTMCISETPLLKCGSFGCEVATINSDPDDIEALIEEIEKFYKLTKKINTDTAHVRVMCGDSTRFDGVIKNGRVQNGIKIS